MEKSIQPSNMETEILYEISLSIGSSLSMETMLHHTLLTMMRVLNLKGVAVHAYEQSAVNDVSLNEESHVINWKDLCSIPRKFIKQNHIANLVDSVNLPNNSSDLGNFYERLPLQFCVNYSHVYIFPLPDCGIILIEKSTQLSDELILSLRKLLIKLSYATLACRYEDYLKQQIQIAQEANNAKSQFLANMSHEVRTPLNSIIGFSELLLTESLSPTSRERVQYIHRSGNLLLTIINDLLDYSKLEHGNLDVSKDAFNLRDVIVHLSSLFNDICLNKGLNLYIEMSDDLDEWFSGDPLRLTQVLGNLLSNAVKFTDAGNISLKIFELSTNNNVVNICFSVSDTGIGLSPEQQSKLFDSFNQVDMSSTRKYGGIGLGLVISQKIINLMGGKGITIESELNKGSNFEFLLPLKRHEKPKDIEPIKKTLLASDSIKFTGQKILIVEDNPINQQIAKTLLQRMNLDIDLANNGLDAVNKVKEINYDLVLMDLQMPVMDGYTATMKIREFNKSIPIIALTAAAMVEDRNKALSIGMDDHIGKPIVSDILANCLKTWLAPNQENFNPIVEPLTFSKKKKILIVDDIEINISLLNGVLIEDYNVYSATSGKEAIDIIYNQNPPDLILLDVMMPEMDGFEVCKIIKSNPVSSNIPIIFITALDDIESEMEGLDLGAVDFITKPFNSKVIKARIRNHLLLKTNADFLQEISHIDALTQISNRRHLNFYLENEFKNSKRKNSPLGIIMIDIDHFKSFNDHYGHGRGDSCLSKISKILKNNLQRPRDFISRFGGEEFTVILPDTDIFGTQLVAEKLRASIENSCITHEHSPISQFVTISVGCTVSDIKDDNPNDLLDRADKALYLAKSNGRNIVESIVINISL